MSTGKIKIVHLVSDLGIGGVQKVVLDICSSADLTKYDISIVTLGKATDLLATYNLSPHIEIIKHTYEYSNSYSLLGYFGHSFFRKRVAEKAKKIIDEVVSIKPHILHVHIHPRELNIGIIIQEATQCKLVYTQHSLLLNPRTISLIVLGLILRVTFRKYNLISVSKNIFDELNENQLVGRNNQLFLIENKLNLSQFYSDKKSKSDFINVVYVARISAAKGHKELVKAWGLLRDLPVMKKLLFVGPDSLNGEIQSYAKELIPDDSIQFLGARMDIREILNNCDFAVFPSHKEGLPIALLEKMAMGLPVIASSIPELKSVINNDVNGLIFEVGNANDLANKMNLLINDASLRIRLGECAKKTVSEKYGSHNIALPNEVVYERLMQQTPRN